MALKFNYNRAHRKLTLEESLTGLVDSGLISSDQAQFIRKKKSRSRQHPLISIADCEIPDRRVDGRKLSLDDLVKWLANYSETEY